MLAGALKYFKLISLSIVFYVAGCKQAQTCSKVQISTFLHFSNSNFYIWKISKVLFYIVKKHVCSLESVYLSKSSISISDRNAPNAILHDFILEILNGAIGVMIFEWFYRKPKWFIRSSSWWQWRAGTSPMPNSIWMWNEGGLSMRWLRLKSRCQDMDRAGSELWKIFTMVSAIQY